MVAAGHIPLVFQLLSAYYDIFVPRHAVLGFQPGASPQGYTCRRAKKEVRDKIGGLDRLQPVFGSQLAPVTGDAPLGSRSLRHPIDGLLLGETHRGRGGGSGSLVGVNVFRKQGGKRERIPHKSPTVVVSFPSADLGEVAGCGALGGERVL